MPNITTHPDDPDDAKLVRVIMVPRHRDGHPAINQPAQDTLADARLDGTDP